MSALELFKLYVTMPSDPEFYLANTLSEVEEELCDGFASLKREVSEEHESIRKTKIHGFVITNS